MPSRNTIEIIINAQDNASDEINSVVGNMQGIGYAALALTTGALATATGAVIGFSVASVNAFGNFQTGINEVFTLLPGITDEAMQGMESSVQRFMNTTGRMSEETLPALYQALSAGVPQENVFDFMELAHQAALGGVTNLETAVDGISSVINSYGTDVLSATQASDLMFTAVRLGKTDFEQLSQSLFNVVPVASAMGVGFADITAGLATITAQGVPTSVATTQLRQMFVELGDTGTDVGQIFQDVAGQSFSDFIAAGNSTADAMALMEEQATAAGIPLNQMFGSIEAGQAALALTGSNMDTFADNTLSMANAAGATSAAYDQMAGTMGQTVAVFQARWQSAMISMGRIITPFIQPLIEIFGVFFAIFEAGVADGETMSDWLTHLPGILRPVGILVANFGAWLHNAADAFQEMVGYLQNGLDPLAAFQTLLFRIAGANVANTFMQLAMGVQRVWNIVTNALEPILQWLGTWITMQDVFVALGIAIGTFVIPAILGILAALAPVILTFAAVVAGVALLRTAWENNFAGIRDITNEIWVSYLQPFMTWLGNYIMDTVLPALENFGAWFLSTGLPLIESYVTGTVIPFFEGWFNFLGDVWNLISPALTSMYDWFITTGLPAIMGFINDTAIPAVQGLWDLLTDAWTLISPGLTAMKEGIDAAFTWIADNVIQPVIDLVNTLIGAFNTAQQTAESTMAAINDTTSNIGTTTNQLGQIGQNLFNGNISFGAVFQSIGNQFRNQFGGAVKAGQPTIVGDRSSQGNWEMFVPNQDGQIVSNADAQGALSAQGDGLTINFNFTGMINESDAQEAAYMLKRELQTQGVLV